MSGTCPRPPVSPSRSRPPSPRRRGRRRPGLWDCLCWLARREGFAVEREDGSPGDGTTFWAARRIRIPPGLTSGQAAWALAHQLGHVLLHNTIAYPPGTTTSGCHGSPQSRSRLRRVHHLRPARRPGRARLLQPAGWAGSDPRAQPAAAILAAGERVTTAAATISRLLDQHLAGNPPGRTAGSRTQQRRHASDERPPQPAASQVTAARHPPRGARPADHWRPGRRHAVLRRPARRSWVPAYLAERGISDAAMRQWHIGYAPGGWTALTGHLRALGHDDDAIQAAGLARQSSRGTLIDNFRDRVMLPIHDRAAHSPGSSAAPARTPAPTCRST